MCLGFLNRRGRFESFRGYQFYGIEITMSQFPYKIKFPPGAIDGMLADAIQMTLGHSTPQYKYDSSGSTVDFTPDQLKAVIRYLESNKKYAEQDKEAFGDMIPDIENALATIQKAVMESKNIAQASRYDGLVTKCDNYLRLALKK